MPVQVLFSAKAEKDLLSIYRYIAVENHAPENAEKFLGQLVDYVTSMLSTFPSAGVKKSRNIRYLVFKKYVITYKIKAEQVLIVAIYRGQNWR